MKPPEDALWSQLTAIALDLIADLTAEGQPLSAREIADATLSAFADVAGVEHYRPSVERFVRDVVGEATAS